jgi:hypothetical protein
MAEARRRLVRPTPASEPHRPEWQARLQRLRQRLEKERATLARWMARLKRAFHATEKTQRQVGRLERQIAREEG